MKVRKIYKLGSFASNMYLVSDGNCGVIIDPSHDFSAIRPEIEAEKLSVPYCLLTHAHFDHFLCVESILENTNATLCIGEKDGNALGDPNLNCFRRFLGTDRAYRGDYHELHDGDKLTVGNLVVEVYEVAGHTRGSVAYRIDNALFVGDLIFEGGGYGRCDLPGGDFQLLLSSIERIRMLPPETVIYPGHGEPFFLSQYQPYF